MLALGLVPEERRGRGAAALESDRLIPSTLSSYIYMIKALSGIGKISELDERLRSDFDGMTLSGATSFWEVPGGAAGFNGSYGGSLCHGWSCAGIYFDGAFRLGVLPLEPGFRTFALKIHPAGLSSLSGEVPTPYGPNRLSWRKRDDGTIDVRLRHPSEIRPGRVADNIRMV